jgi:hypothetical protein
MDPLLAQVFLNLFIFALLLSFVVEFFSIDDDEPLE